MIRILVTGGAGFIASHLVEHLLERNYEVRVLDNLLRGNKLPYEIRQQIDFIQGDICDLDTVRKAVRGCQFVAHFAAYLGVDIVADNPVGSMEVEAMGTRNLVNAALCDSIESFIYASTSGVYGKSAIDAAVDENFSASPTSSYAIAKRFNEIYLKSIYQQKGLNSASLRFFNVYGPRQDTRMVIPRFFQQALSGEPLTVFGDGRQTRDFTYITDTVRGIVEVLEKVRGAEIINIANGSDLSILEIAKKVVEITGSKSEIQLVEAPPHREEFEVIRRCGDSSKLERLTKFRPGIRSDEGIEMLYKAEYA